MLPKSGPNKNNRLAKTEERKKETAMPTVCCVVSCSNTQEEIWECVTFSDTSSCWKPERSYSAVITREKKVMVECHSPFR